VLIRFTDGAIGEIACRDLEGTLASALVLGAEDAYERLVELE
jgi:hypothetical protein